MPTSSETAMIPMPNPALWARRFRNSRKGSRGSYLCSYMGDPSVRPLGRALRARSRERRRLAPRGLRLQEAVEARIAIEGRRAVQEQAAGVRGGPVGRIEARAQQTQVGGELSPVVSRVGDPPRQHPGPAALDVEETSGPLEPLLRHPAQALP